MRKWHVPKWRVCRHTLWNCPDGVKRVDLLLVPRWALGLTQVVEWLDGERHRLCEAPDWAWHLPLGHPRYDRSEPDDPFLLNSLGSRLHNLVSWALFLEDRHGRVLLRTELFPGGEVKRTTLPPI